MVELSFQIKLNEKVNLMDDENFNVFVEFVKRTNALDENCVIDEFKKGTQCVPRQLLTERQMTSLFRKLDFSSEINQSPNPFNQGEKRKQVVHVDIGHRSRSWCV